MKKISRILWVMVTSCFVFLYTEKSTNAKEVSISEADISENYSEQSAVEITDESLANLALNFAKEFKGTEDLVVSSIIPIYDTEEKIISYSVDFIKEGVTHGYVIIDGMATVFLTNFIRCRTSFRMLFRLSLTMSLLGCDDLRQELTV
ncbi:hypothetical protein MXM24_15520, partial [Enterococcus gallinarum]|nr:hypothetical protein [Enterococcus gallinarum]